MFTGTPDGIIIHDAEGFILDANEATTQRLEIPERRFSEETSRNSSRWIAPRKWVTMRKPPWREDAHFETTYVSASGKTIPAEVNERRIHWRKVQAVLSISRNITERKQAEGAAEIGRKISPDHRKYVGLCCFSG